MVKEIVCPSEDFIGLVRLIERSVFDLLFSELDSYEDVRRVVSQMYPRQQDVWLEKEIRNILSEDYNRNELRMVMAYADYPRNLDYAEDIEETRREIEKIRQEIVGNLRGHVTGNGFYDGVGCSSCLVDYKTWIDKEVRRNRRFRKSKHSGVAEFGEDYGEKKFDVAVRDMDKAYLDIFADNAGGYKAR